MTGFLWLTNIMLVLASAGSAVAVLLWGFWGPLLWFVSVLVFAVTAALFGELVRLLIGGPPGHDAFWGNVWLIGSEAMIWWMLAIPSIAVAILLRWVREWQLSRNLSSADNNARDS